MGRRDILALREDLRKARNEECTLATFHEELLQYGALPTALARWGMGLAEVGYVRTLNGERTCGGER